MKILAVCGNGLGSSMILKIKIASVLKEIGVANVEVGHCDLTSAPGENADIIVVTKDLASNFANFSNVIALASIMNTAELKEKLQHYITQTTV